ncbi:MAG: hypothetical protein AAF629_28710, partial [Chloroflexota bacterium]
MTKLDPEIRISPQEHFDHTMHGMPHSGQQKHLGFSILQQLDPRLRHRDQRGRVLRCRRLRDGGRRGAARRARTP